MAFNNQTMRVPTCRNNSVNMPHIALIDGYWRVSVDSYSGRIWQGRRRWAWNKAHYFALELNQSR